MEGYKRFIKAIDSLFFHYYGNDYELRSTWNTYSDPVAWLELCTDAIDSINEELYRAHTNEQRTAFLSHFLYSVFCHSDLSQERPTNNTYCNLELKNALDYIVSEANAASSYYRGLNFESILNESLKRAECTLKFDVASFKQIDTENGKHDFQRIETGIFCKIVSECGIMSIGDLNAPKHCQLVCERYNIQYSDKVRQHYNTTLTKVRSKYIIDKILPVIPEQDANKIKEYITNPLATKRMYA